MKSNGKNIGNSKDANNNRGTISLDININPALLNKAMKSIEESSKRKNTVNTAVVDSHMLNLTNAQPSKKPNIAKDQEMEVFENSMNDLRNDNKKLQQKVEKVGTYTSHETKKVSGSVGENTNRGGKGGKPFKNEPKRFGSKSNRNPRSASSKFDQSKNVSSGKALGSEIDVQEYDMLYGGSIVVRSSSIGASNIPNKKVRVSNMPGSNRNVAAVTKHIDISGNSIAIKSLADKMSVKASKLLKALIGLGVNSTANETIDKDTIELICGDLGYSVNFTKSEIENKIENLLNGKVQNQGDVRAPLVTIMGHVDHGKTSLLDVIRKSDVASGESGGITQHIGAYTVNTNGRKICFIDTPGHAAFAEMRARGAKVTDIIVLVVAADDGVMAQTVEAINHIKAAGICVIVAANKIDKPGADLDKLKSDLMKHEIVPEEYGGDVSVVPVSAIEKKNIDKLLETILLYADMLNLHADPKGDVLGTIIESKMDKKRGIVATLLVQNGTLRQGDVIVSNSTMGRIRVMIDDKGNKVASVSPSTPVEVFGLDGVPNAGERFMVTSSEKEALKIIQEIKRIADEGKESKSRKSSASFGNSKLKELNLVIKADVQGSIEAIVNLLSSIKDDECKVNIVHQDVGMISLSDVSLAVTTNSMVIGFNVSTDGQLKKMIEENGVDVRIYSVIYNLESDVKKVMSSMLDSEFKEHQIGTVIIRKIFQVGKVGIIAGSYVSDGVVKKGSMVKIMRNGVKIGESNISSLRSHSDNVKEVTLGHECGVCIESKDIEIHEQDTMEVFQVEEVKRLIQ